MLNSKKLHRTLKKQSREAVFKIAIVWEYSTAKTGELIPTSAKHSNTTHTLLHWQGQETGQTSVNQKPY